MLKKRNALSQEEIAKVSKSVQEAVMRSSEFRSAEVVGAYFALGSEAKTDLLVTEARELGKEVALPRVEGDRISFYEFSLGMSLVRGRFGIMEPPPNTPVKAMDLVIVPGVAFDVEGYRLGYGKGYYDKFLSESSAFSIGLAYGFQLVDRLPRGSHDVRLNSAATENGVIRFAE
jgi:5-formyltetrahydrofolate cyclo-ligase